MELNPEHQWGKVSGLWTFTKPRSGLSFREVIHSLDYCLNPSIFAFTESAGGSGHRLREEYQLLF